MVISTPTLSHKIDRTFTAPTKKLAPFGPSDVHLEDIEKLPDTERSQYSPSVAYLMAVISAWSYSDEAVLGAKLRYCGMSGATTRICSGEMLAYYCSIKMAGTPAGCANRSQTSVVQ